MPDLTDLPHPRRWPEPITLEQYTAFTPEKLELVKGYLIAGPDDTQDRLNLLALLLANCGLEEAVNLASPEDWRDALDRSWGDC